MGIVDPRTGETLPLVIDISNYDMPFDENTANAFVVNGVDFIIIGGQRPGIAASQASACERAGLPILGFYAFLYFGIDTLGQTQAAIELAQQFDAGWVLLDCESIDSYDNAKTPEDRILELWQCVIAVTNAGLRPAIYTGGWWWPGYMGNTDQFKHLPLWHSAYPNDGGAVRKVGYGGWIDVALHQFTSERVLAGRVRDHNYLLDKQFIGEDDMSPQDREVFEAMVAIFGGREKLLEAKRKGMDYLLGYELEQVAQGQLAARLQTAINTVNETSLKQEEMMVAFKRLAADFTERTRDL